MTNGLAIAVVVLVVLLAIVAAGLAWWLTRGRENVHDPSPRIQPLFGSELLRAVDDGIAEDLPVASTHATPSGAGQAVRVSPDARPAAGRNGTTDHSANGRGFGAGAADRNGSSTNGSGFGVASRPVIRQQSFRTEFHAGASASHGSADYALDEPGTEGLVDGHAGDAANAALPPTHVRNAPLGSGQSPLAPLSRPVAGPVSRFAPPMPAAGSSESHSVHFEIPTDGTLQFLPGRLEIVTGQDAGREIRFVRLPDSLTPEISFGRNEGAPYRHVQLRDGTVSRMHARMRMAEGVWTLTNLSTTNPVTYNGRTLGDGEEQALAHDDRIEMGEVAFRFRQR